MLISWWLPPPLPLQELLLEAWWPHPPASWVQWPLSRCRAGDGRRRWTIGTDPSLTMSSMLSFHRTATRWIETIELYLFWALVFRACNFCLERPISMVQTFLSSWKQVLSHDVSNILIRPKIEYLHDHIQRVLFLTHRICHLPALFTPSQILKPPTNYNPIRTPARKLTATPTPMGMSGFRFQMDDDKVKIVDDLQPQGAGKQELPYMKMEDAQYFSKVSSLTKMRIKVKLVTVCFR